MAKSHNRPVKVGDRVGQGPAPGYLWNVDIIDRAYDEAMSFLDEDQYDHMASQVRELALQDDPTHSDTIDVKSIEDYHEISDKGGILRKLSVRIFFFARKETRTIVVLGAIKKENNGATPPGDRLNMRRRKRLYLDAFGVGAPASSSEENPGATTS